MANQARLEPFRGSNHFRRKGVNSKPPFPAAGDLALNAIPDAKGAALLLKVGIKELSEHALIRMVGRKISPEMVKNAVTSGVKYTDTAHPGSIAHVLQGGGPGGRNLTVVTNASRSKVITVIDHGSKPLPAAKARFTQVKGN